MVDTKRPRFVCPISELLTVCAVLSLLYALLLPAVNSARDRQKLPPVQAVLIPFYEGQVWWFVAGFPVVTTCCVAVGIIILRGFLPASVRKRFPWSASKERETVIDTPTRFTVAVVQDKPAGPTWAKLAAILAVSATTILLFAASRVHADRTHRRPFITFEGWMADRTLPIAIVGWVLSCVAIVAAGVYIASVSSPHDSSPQVQPNARWSGTAAFGFLLGTLNLFGSCLYWMVLTED